VGTVASRSPATDLLALGVFLGLAFAAAAFGGIFTGRAVSEWYPTIDKPGWTPPGSVIGAAWSVLYPVIGIAGWMLWRAGGEGHPVALPLAFWGIQMLLNAAWSWAFFGLRSPGLGVIVIALLWLSIVAVIVTAWAPQRWTSFLFLPYLAWVSFAGTLNIAIWRLNA
jgi:translocator protein